MPETLFPSLLETSSHVYIYYTAQVNIVKCLSYLSLVSGKLKASLSCSTQ